MTPHTLALAIGWDGDTKYDINMLRAAARRVDAFLAAGHGVIGGHDGKYFDAITAVAEEIKGPELAQLEELLDAFDGLMRNKKSFFAIDVACDRWTPMITAAYYFGLCIGLRLTRDGGAR